MIAYNKNKQRGKEPSINAFHLGKKVKYKNIYIYIQGKKVKE